MLIVNTLFTLKHHVLTQPLKVMLYFRVSRDDHRSSAHEGNTSTADTEATQPPDMHARSDSLCQEVGECARANDDIGGVDVSIKVHKGHHWLSTYVRAHPLVSFTDLASLARV